MPETFNRTEAKLTTTSITEVYRAPASAGNRSIVLSCLVANVDGVTPADITVAIWNSADSSELVKLANTISVPPDASLEIIANKLVLKDGERLKATAGSAPAGVQDLEVSVTALEIT